MPPFPIKPICLASTRNKTCCSKACLEEEWFEEVGCVDNAEDEAGWQVGRQYLVSRCVYKGGVTVKGAGPLTEIQSDGSKTDPNL